MIFEKTIADNYSSYTEDERGYNYQAWDITRIEEIRSHDRILHRDKNELISLDATMLNDLERWAFARALRMHQLIDAFFDQCEQLITSKSNHPALNYLEILEAYAEELAGANQLDKAKNIIKNTPPDDLSLDLEGRLSLLARDENGARTIFASLITEHPEDAELHFDIAENFARHGFKESALEWLNTAQAAAKRTKDDALVVDIELLRLEITRDDEIIEE